MSARPPERGEFISNDAGPVQDQEDLDLLKRALAEVDRYRSMDRLIPTYHNVVTVAVIEVRLLSFPLTCTADPDQTVPSLAHPCQSCPSRPSTILPTDTVSGAILTLNVTRY